MKTKKESRITQFRNWYKLVTPDRKIFMISLIAACITAIFNVLEPIAAANVITCITETKYQQAMLWLVVVFVMIFLRNAAWDINYWNQERLIGNGYTNVSMKIYDKIISASDVNFKSTSKEKIINIISADIYTVSNFSDIICTKTSYLFRTIVTIIIVSTSNLLAAALIVVISILNYFLINLAARKIGYYGKKVSESKDKLLEYIADVNEIKTLIKDTNSDEYYKDLYNKKIWPYIQNRTHRTRWRSFIDNWIYVIWQAIVCLLSIYLVYMVSKDSLSLAIYLVIIGYLAPTIEKMNSACLIFQELDTANVAAGRIKTILNFSSKELVEYGKRMTNKIDGQIEFINVNIDASKSYHTENINDLKDFNITINKNEMTLIVGTKGCGKRSIFHILRRAVKPDSGKVVLSGIDLYKYSPKVHYQNISYTTHKPYFYKGTIKSNFEMYTNDIKKIRKACVKVGIIDKIDQLQNKFDSTIDEIDNWTQKDKYLLGLARAIVIDSEVIMIYEFPNQLSLRDRADISRLFTKLVEDGHTIIVFASSDDVAPLADKVIYVSHGQVDKIEVK